MENANCLRNTLKMKFSSHSTTNRSVLSKNLYVGTPMPISIGINIFLTSVFYCLILEFLDYHFSIICGRWCILVGTTVVLYQFVGCKKCVLQRTPFWPFFHFVLCQILSISLKSMQGGRSYDDDSPICFCLKRYSSANTFLAFLSFCTLPNS